MTGARTIALGVSGSIAAYKAIYLARLLTEAGIDVWPILTRSASRFVGPLSFSALTGHRAITDLWSQAAAGEIGHVEVAHKIQCLVLAPCSADLLSRLANGQANDPLSAVALATRAPWVVAPAMETQMWENSLTQTHVQQLRKQGVHFLEPVRGALASGRVGGGRMAEPEEIFDQVLAKLTCSDLQGETILVTAGPTREFLDPARFLSNPSTGKMGFAIAKAAMLRGAKVTLVCGPNVLPAIPNVERVDVISTDDMLKACEKVVQQSSIVVMAAAPADHRPVTTSPSKSKKRAVGARYQLELESTPDILKKLRARTARRIVVGFAAETDAVLEHATHKLKEKNLDLIVANEIGRRDSGFGADTNRAYLIEVDQPPLQTPLQGKDELANTILDRIVALRRRRSLTIP